MTSTEKKQCFRRPTWDEGWFIPIFSMVVFLGFAVYCFYLKGWSVGIILAAVGVSGPLFYGLIRSVDDASRQLQLRRAMRQKSDKVVRLSDFRK